MHVLSRVKNTVKGTASILTATIQNATVSPIHFVNRWHLLSKHWVQLFGNVALFAVHLLLANFHHHIGVCLSIWVCGCQIGCLRVHKEKKHKQLIQMNEQKIHGHLKENTIPYQHACNVYILV